MKYLAGRDTFKQSPVQPTPEPVISPISEPITPESPVLGSAQEVQPVTQAELVCKPESHAHWYLIGALLVVIISLILKKSD